MPADFGQQLRQKTVAVRLKQEKFGTNKRLTAEQIRRAADEFNTESSYLRATKKLLDTKDEAYQDVTSQLCLAKMVWRMMTVPYPEPGIRLIRKDKIPEFREKLDKIKEDLTAAVAALDAKYADLREKAREQLGELFNPADYPESLQGQFRIEFDWPSVEPPDYLKQLHPDLWEAQSKLVEARFGEAVALAEQAFTAELQKMVAHLADKLKPGDDGKPKVFRDSAVENMVEFFQRFQDLNVGSNEQLESLVKQAQDLVAGVSPGQLRKDATLRQSLSEELGTVAQTLEAMIVAKPNRAFSLEEEAQEAEAAA